jgi:tRNA pseudouridine13 synthase
MSSLIVREREQDDGDIERYSKRTRIDGPDASISASTGNLNVPPQTTSDPLEPEHILPPSHSLLGIPLPVQRDDAPMVFLETDVGISEYIGRGVPKIEGIIKQRSLLLAVH